MRIQWCNSRTRDVPNSDVDSIAVSDVTAAVLKLARFYLFCMSKARSAKERSKVYRRSQVLLVIINSFGQVPAEHVLVYLAAALMDSREEHHRTNTCLHLHAGNKLLEHAGDGVMTTTVALKIRLKFRTPSHARQC